MTKYVRCTRILSLASLALFAACGGGLPYPGLTADEVYALALQAREQEDWDDAIQAFEFVLFSPGFNRAAEARLLLAGVQYSKGRFIESRSEYQRVIDRWPADTVAVRAALGVCRSLASVSPITQRDQAFTRQARLACRQVDGDFAGAVMGLEAARAGDGEARKRAVAGTERGGNDVERGRQEQCALYFEEVASQYPDTEWAPWALYRMIEVFGRIGYQRDVEATRELLLDVYPDSEPAQLLLENGGA